MNASSLLARITMALTLGAASSAAAEITPELAERLRPIIEEGLASTDANVQSIAVRAAPALMDDALIDAVGAQLTNTDVSVRIAAATALLLAGEMESDARAALVQEFSSGDGSVRATLLDRSLPTLPLEEQAAVLDAALDAITAPDAFRQVVTNIAQRGAPPVYALLLRAATISPELRTIIVEEVARAERPEGIAVVQALVGNRSSDTHADGATLAMALNTAEARAAIEGLLGSEDAALAQRVGFFLADYGSAAALERVRDLALNPEMPEDLRMSALAVVRDRAATTASFEQVLALTTETGRSLEFTLAAFTWLGALNSPEARDHLNTLNNGLFADDRLRAITGLGYLQDGAPVADFTAILSGSGEQALRAAAARALGHVGTSECVQVLTQQLFMERDEIIKMAIIQAIADAGDASAATQLTYEFAAQNASVTLAVLDALGKLGNTSVARTIEGLVTSAREPEVRWKATVVLTMLDPDAGRIRLLQAIERPPENFRADLEGFSQELLNEIDETLLLNSTQAVREEALYRVLTRADGGYSVFRPLLDGGLSPEVRNTALSVVIARRNPEDAELFVRLTEDPDRAVRMQATTALAELGLESQATMFLDRLDHADFTLRLMAAYAVVNIYAGNELLPPAPEAPAAEEAPADAEVPAP